MEKNPPKTKMPFTTTFNILSTGLNFKNKQKSLLLKEQTENKINEQTKALSFPNFSNEKSEIIKVKKHLSKIAKTTTSVSFSEEKKLKLIKEQREILSSLYQDLYNKLRLTASSYDDIDPLVTFTEIQRECKLRPKFTSDIIPQYKFIHPSPIQSIVIPLLIHHHNVLASSETGSGKTLAYLIPSIHNSLLNKLKSKRNKILIILPTKELSRQIYNECIIYSKLYTEGEIKTKYITKGTIISIKTSPSPFISNNDIFIATPKNILNLFSICNELLLSNTLYLILDEADKFFDLGFAEIIDEILSKVAHEKEIVKGFFSATLLASLGSLITTQIFDAITITIGITNIPARHIEQEFVYCECEEGKIIGLRNVFKGKVEFPMLIFVEGIKKVKSVYKYVKYETMKISYIHSEMSKNDREDEIRKFRMGETWVLICSDLLSRGIDFKNVKTVINYDCPYRTVNYIHRIGRTGRAGKRGKAITFIVDDDVGKLGRISEMINDVIKENPQMIKCPQWLINLNKKTHSNK